MIYRAIVQSINGFDLYVRVPRLFGQDIVRAVACLPIGRDYTTESAGDPAHTHTVTAGSTFVLPSVGDEVWITFEAGDREDPVWIGVSP